MLKKGNFEENGRIFIDNQTMTLYKGNFCKLKAFAITIRLNRKFVGVIMVGDVSEKELNKHLKQLSFNRGGRISPS